jgi:hypothetical protein
MYLVTEEADAAAIREVSSGMASYPLPSNCGGVSRAS